MIVEDYFKLFGTDTDILRKTAAAAMQRGAGYADLFFEHSEKDSISLRDSKVSATSSCIDRGVGIRALCAEKSGYAWCDGTSPDRMAEAAGAAGLIADHIAGGKNCGTYGIRASAVREIPHGSYYPDSGQVEGIRFKECATLLSNIEAVLRDGDKRIDRVMASIRFHDRKIMNFNTLGELSCDFQPLRSLIIGINFKDGSKSDSRTVSKSFRSDFSLFDGKTVSDMTERLLSGIDRSLEAGKPKGGMMPVVLAAGASGILLHEAMGHAFEADFCRKGQSIFSGRMGRSVCPKGINIVDDATLYGNRGSLNVDDEGVPGRKTYMVTDGVLTSYLHDRISAAHFGVEPSGNGRREDFRNPPLPRMRLTYMENGGCDPAAIIADVKKGLWVDEFGNGEVKIGEGDFSFYVASGRLIENGRLTAPVKDVNVIGNGPEALQNIRAVGNDLRIDDSCWTCGKGQSVPVGCGMPSVLVDSLTVGGK